MYDAIRLLESTGPAETQHTNPRMFRAVGVDEALDTLRREYEERAVFGRGFDDGLVAIVRRPMTTGMLTDEQRPLDGGS